MDELLTRTIKLPLDVGDEGQLLLRTMYLGTKVFNAHAEWGFAKKVFDNAEMHRAIYKNICEEFPSVPSNLILSCRDAACSSLRSMNSQNRWKTKPQKKGYSALKYPHASVGLDFNACTVSLSCVRPK